MTKPGANVWAPHSELAWVHGVVTKKADKDGNMQVRAETGEVLSVHVDECELSVDSLHNLASIEDLTKLPALHEPALLKTLQERFQKENMYTYTGPILIALNPFKDLGIYGEKQMKKYITAPLGAELPPHAYAVADAAYKKMIANRGRNQSILVSGESGAGKTETTKIVMEYLTEISSSGGKKSDKAISKMILQANPLLEAFGNAKTLRNDNSSRFGKMIKMQFEADRRSLKGAQITTYLLEKARVPKQGDGERNYHIFYELVAGASKSDRAKWGLPSQSECNYVNQSGVFTRGDVDDKKQFQATVKAMDVLNFTQDERDHVFNAVAAIMHLGNISFASSSNEGSEISSSSKGAAAKCSELLGVDASELEKVLCTRVIRVGGMFDASSSIGSEVVAKRHTVQQAEDSRDALAMTLYERLFGWIVWRTNSVIGGTTTPPPSSSTTSLKLDTVEGFDQDYTIGCLDVFGFEVFERNSFEQFCINYCNEQLQKQFNEFVFEIEQQEYEREQIDWTYVEFPDNSACLEMIEARPIGLLSLVDEECMYPAGNDRSLAAKFYEHLPKRFDSFYADNKLRINNNFVVRHFAGDVTYTTDGFYRKNKNELRQEAVDLIVSSSDALVSVLLPPDADDAAGGADMARYFAQVGGLKQASTKPKHSSIGSRGSSRSQLQQKTVGSHFKTQLRQAMQTIRTSEPHYIRCLKPNDNAMPLQVDPVRLVEQLRYSGVIEVIRVARAGYPTRFSLAEFVENFAILGLKPTKGKSAAFEAHKLVKANNTKAIQKVCDDIVKGAKLVHGKDYQIGLTKVFMRADTYTTLQIRKNEKVKASVVKIQRAYRAYARRQKQTQAVVRIQAIARGMVVRNKTDYKALIAERLAAAEHSKEDMEKWKEEATKEKEQVQEEPLYSDDDDEPFTDLEEEDEFEDEEEGGDFFGEFGISEMGKYMIMFVGFPLILNSIATNPSVVLSILILLFGMVAYIMQTDDEEEDNDFYGDEEEEDEFVELPRSVSRSSMVSASSSAAGARRLRKLKIARKKKSMMSMNPVFEDEDPLQAATVSKSSKKLFARRSKKGGSSVDVNSDAVERFGAKAKSKLFARQAVAA